MGWGEGGGGVCDRARTPSSGRREWLCTRPKKVLKYHPFWEFPGYNKKLFLTIYFLLQGCMVPKMKIAEKVISRRNNCETRKILRLGS